MHLANIAPVPDAALEGAVIQRTEFPIRIGNLPQAAELAMLENEGYVPKRNSCRKVCTP